MVTVSVITPVYNAEAYLGETIRSVLGQSLSDFEWIVVDDGSTDGTSRLLSSLIDPRVRIVRQENGGVSAARNAGLDRARGRYVTFVDADDVLPPRSLETRAAYLDATPEAGIVDGIVSYRDAALVSEVRRHRPSPTVEPLFPRLVELDESFFAGPFYMMRADCIGEARFPVGVTHCEDLLFFLEVARKSGLVYGSVPEVVYHYRTGHGSAMADLDGLEAGYQKLLMYLASVESVPRESLDATAGRVSRIMRRSWLRAWRFRRAVFVGLRVKAALR